MRIDEKYHRLVISPAAENDLLLAMLATLVGADVDLKAARIAFETTRGDFATRFAAAIEARIAELAKPEAVIEIPAHPEELTKGALGELVRPGVIGFLKSYPTKRDLLEHLWLIKRRQERRPAWIPTADHTGRRLPLAELSDGADNVPPAELDVARRHLFSGQCSGQIGRGGPVAWTSSSARTARCCVDSDVR